MIKELKEAIDCGVCVAAIEALQDCATLEEALTHPKAPQWAVWYAVHVVGGRWPEGEAVIRRSPEEAYLYARYAIQGRWAEGEEELAQSPTWAYYYARNVVGGRWPEGEDAIAQSPEAAHDYARHVIRGRWLEGEQALLARGRLDLLVGYAEEVIGGRWPEAEAVILAESPRHIYDYGIRVIGGRDWLQRWPEAEQALYEWRLGDRKLPNRIRSRLVCTDAAFGDIGLCRG